MTARLRVQLAVSADGFIAPPDGSLDWLAPFPAGEFGIAEFLAGIGAVVMGRTCYDEAQQMGGLSFGTRTTLVVTSRSLPGVATTTVEHLPAAIAELETGGKDIWLFGGARTIAACLERRLVDTLELAVVPRLLGAGLRLYVPRAPALDKLKLVAARPMTKDVVWLEYSIER